MEFDAVLLAPRREKMLKQGHWFNQTILQSLDEAVQLYPNKIGLVSYKTEDQSEKSFSYRQMLDTANKIALGLKQLGIQKHDIVSCQLPNWWEFTLLYIACRRIGAVLNPLMPIFRERELSFMLKHTESKIFIVPKIFRKFDYENLAYQLKNNINSIEHVIVIDGDGENSFEKLLLNHGLEQDPNSQQLLNEVSITADDIAQLIFTSGTTGEPKGVMHTANTLFANIIPYAERLHLNQDDVIFMGSPMAHQTGFMYGLIMPVILKAKAVLLDVWDVNVATQLIHQHQASFTMASTPFLNDLSEAAISTQNDLSSLKIFLCAGAPIPSVLVQKARQNIGVKVISAWGMTECGAITTTCPEDDDERSFNTDGRPLAGVEVKIIDDQGQQLPLNQAGTLMIRSCSNFGGYLKRPHLNETDADDWFDTGDIAYLDEQGYIRIAGRKKDVIIRGGENIPVAEVESLMYLHPDIAMVALVPYPDERMGEKACAIVKLKEGSQEIQLQDLVLFLKSHHLSNQYLPERLEIWNEIPMTPSGKIQKFKLRELLKDMISA